MPVDVAGADQLVEQSLGLERREDMAAQSLVGAGMAGAEVDDLEAVRRLGIGQDHEAVSAPHLVLCRRFGSLDLGRNLSAVGAVELGAQNPLIDLTLVEVREEQSPPGVAAIHWRLLTTLPVPDLAAARQMARFYRLRWRIEQTFRACKNDGLGLPDLQTHGADRLFKMAALAIGAAVSTIQLVDARDGGNRLDSDVAEPAVPQAAAAIGPTLEGKTQRQQNPHRPGSLPWLAWIVARLGGWNCYYKPPGPKTIRAGWDKAGMTVGFHIAMAANIDCPQ